MPTLQFKGKSFVENHHLTVPYHQLLPDNSASLTDKVSLSDNLIIHGDNLIALKALLPNYQGRVKCVYIDPPYNTGKESWRYNDNVNSPMIQDWLKQNKPVDKEDLTRHDKWLCMMMPRLTLLRELLRDNGIILISIDDNEAHHLRILMDEIFGSDNFIAQLVWEKGRKNDARLFSVGHEYLMVYARSLQTLKTLKTIWREPKPGAREVWDQYVLLRDKYGGNDRTIEQNLKKWFASLPKKSATKALSRYWRVDENGPWRDRDISWPGGDGPRYEVIHPKTKQPVAIPERGWGFANEEAMQRQIDLGLIEFRDDHTTPPFRKAHLRPVMDELDEDDGLFEDDEITSEEVVVGMQVMPSVIYKQSQVAVKYLRKLMGSKAFDNPKDHEVLTRIIRYCTTPNEGDIILDSFAGSGTTGHAVLLANSEDKGNRQFILVETEDYANNLTAERIRRVISGVTSSNSKLPGTHLPGTFSFFNLGESIDIEAVLSGDPELMPAYEELARYLFYTSTGEEFVPENLDEGKNYIGESRSYHVYLFYKPDVEYLQNTALTLEMVRSLPMSGEKERLVFAPTHFVDSEYLEQYHVKFVRLPFEIYRFPSS